jgi:protein-tyrosine phosphatase
VSLVVERKRPPRYEKESVLSAGWSIHSIPIEEGAAPSLEQIREFMTVLQTLPPEMKVLVFCQSEKGRTACMAAAYLIAKGLRARSAIARVCEACSDTGWPIAKRRRVFDEYARSMKI